MKTNIKLPLDGKKFNRLTVIEYSHRSLTNNKTIMYKCLCDCGKYTTVARIALTSGNTKSCGCFNNERIVVHNMSKHPLYRIWRGMIDRCTNNLNYDYCNYGGRGITVCDEWLNSINVFIKDMSERPSKNHSIERLDNNIGYLSSNCKWATAKEQANNRRNNHKLTFNNETLSVSEWSAKLGINVHTIHTRILKNLSVDEILNTTLKINQHR